eukprot:1162053-Pelagomonas_calceolata.AAC.8
MAPGCMFEDDTKGSRVGKGARSRPLWDSVLQDQKRCKGGSPQYGIGCRGLWAVHHAQCKHAQAAQNPGSLSRWSRQVYISAGEKLYGSWESFLVRTKKLHQAPGPWLFPTTEAPQVL